jgi:MFS family permease
LIISRKPKGIAVDIAQPASPPITEPVAVGRPTRALPWRHLLNLSIYWLGINVIWSGLGHLILQKRMEEILGTVAAPLGFAIGVFIPVTMAILVQPTVAALSDYTVSRWGRRKPYILIGTSLDMVFLIGLASSNTIVTLLAFLMLLQFSSNFAQGPFQGYVPDLVPAKQVGVASGLMGVMITLGQIAGVFIAGYGLLLIGQGLPPSQAFFWPTIALGAIELVTMLLLVATVDEGRAGPAREGRSWFQIALGTWGTDILRLHSYVWLLVSRLFFLAVPAAVLAFGIWYLERTLGFTPPPAGASLLDLRYSAAALYLIGAVLGVVTLVSAFPAARISDRVGRKRVIYSSIAFGAVGVIGIVIAPSLPLAVLSVVPVGIGAGSFLAVDWALMTDIIPKATAGRYMGISNVATASAGPLGVGIGAAVLFAVTFLGLPAGADLTTNAEASTLYSTAPRAAFAVTLVFFAISAWALRHVDETRRED